MEAEGFGLKDLRKRQTASEAATLPLRSSSDSPLESERADKGARVALIAADGARVAERAARRVGKRS